MYVFLEKINIPFNPFAL